MPSILPQLKGANSRADLLIAIALAGNDPGRQAAYAAMLGFAPVPIDEKEHVPFTQSASTAVPVDQAFAASAAAPQKLHFVPYRLTAITNTETPEKAQEPVESRESGGLDAHDMRPWDANHPMPQAQPIVPWTRLWPRLRQAVAVVRAAAVDVPRLAQQISHGRVVRRLPRKQRLNWPDPLPVVADFSDRLTPYWQDWHGLQRQLRSRLRSKVQCYRLRGVPQQSLQRLRTDRPDAGTIPWPQLHPGSTLLIISDLGMTNPTHPWPRHCWQTKLNELQRHGVRTIVLSPASLRHLQPQLTNRAAYLRLSPDSCLRPQRRVAARNVLPLDGLPSLSQPAAMLLTLMSVATRVEPPLLRALRGLLPEGWNDAGIEGEVWCHSELDTAATGCSLASWAVAHWQEKFRQLPPLLQQRALDCLRGWHAQLPQAIHHEETLLWQHLTKVDLSAGEQAKAAAARKFFNKLANSLQAPPEPAVFSRMRMAQLAERHIRWVLPVLGGEETYLHRLWDAVIDAAPERARNGLPAGIDPAAWLQQQTAIAPQRMQLLQDPRHGLQLQPPGEPLPNGATHLAAFDIDRDTLLWGKQENGQRPIYFPWHWQAEGSPESIVPSLFPLLRMTGETGTMPPYPALILYTGRQRMQFDGFIPPAWASAWGQDACGLFADLTVKHITQRFRWIFPGSFLMGSPENEAERSFDEILHPVTLTRGFWLADTVSTQALWQAVMDDNPSYFTGDPRLPVENVNWLDVQRFIERLNALFPDLQARLPSEAQWEYACRAGTQTPFSFENIITSEEVNCKGNYFYRGIGKSLYRGKTVSVKSLSPNPWGLYEMHGNVWEWCADWYGDYLREAVIDPEGPDQGDRRVVRGGSWDFTAQYSRSAYRYWFWSAYRSDSLSFRLALG